YIPLHTLIFGRKARVGYVIDHINGNKFDNRKENLREVNYDHSAQNRNMPKGKYNKFTGARYSKANKNWKASYSNINLGVYKTEEEAAKVYDKYVIHRFGENIKTNFQ